MTAGPIDERFPAPSKGKITIARAFLDDLYLESRAFPRRAAAPTREQWMFEQFLKESTKTRDPGIVADAAEITAALREHGWPATLGWLRSLAAIA